MDNNNEQVGATYGKLEQTKKRIERLERELGSRTYTSELTEDQKKEIKSELDNLKTDYTVLLKKLENSQPVTKDKDDTSLNESEDKPTKDYTKQSVEPVEESTNTVA
jgi:hypothetical protein